MSKRVGKLGVQALSPNSPKDLKYHAVAKHLAHSKTLRTPGFSFDARHLKQWPILGNDKYGCCTFAGIVRLIMNNWARRGKVLDVPDKLVIQAYLDHTGGKDDGAMPVNALNYMRKVGIKLADGKMLRVEAFARVSDDNTFEWNSATQTFHGMYVASALPANLDGDKDDVLELTPPDKWTDRDNPGTMGGHAYNVLAFERESRKVCMWDDIWDERIEWTRRYRKEGWVILDTEEPDGPLRTAMLEQLDVIKAS